MGEVIDLRTYRDAIATRPVKMRVYRVPAAKRTERVTNLVYTIAERAVAIAILVAVVVVLGVGLWR